MYLTELSDTSPDSSSYSGSLRSISMRSFESLASVVVEDYRPPRLKAAVDFLHYDNEFLGAAESGDVDLLKDFIR